MADYLRMQSRVGNRYFDQSERLGELLSSLAKIAENSGIAPARAQHLRQLRSSLRTPFLFVVAGEVNSGKSNFLNALFGDEFCDTAPTPSTERIYYFKHGEESRDIMIDDSFVEMFRPAPFLRDFHIVDTPGTNSIAEGHQEITERFIPMADLVIFVFSVTNPWGASTWDFINQIYEGWLKQVVFVVQQKDLRTPHEIEAILEHMAVTSKERLGRTFPTFAVSAKQAISAKTSEHGQSQLLEHSGFNELEEHISGIVSDLPSVGRKFTSILRSARAVAAEVERKFDAELEIIRRAEAALAEIEHEIEMETSRTMDHLAEVTDKVAGEFGKTRIQLTAMFEKKTNFASALHGGPGFVSELEVSLPEDVTQIARNASGSETRTIEAGLPALFDRLSAFVSEEFGQAPDPGSPPVWTEAGGYIPDDLERRLHGALVDTETVGQLESALDRQRGNARIAAFMLCLTVLLAVGGFTAGSTPALYLALGLGLLGIPLQYFLGKRNRARARRLFNERMDRAKSSIARQMNEAHPAYLHRYMRLFSALFDPARDQSDTRKSHFEPLFSELAESKEALDALEEDLFGEEEEAD